MNDLFTELLVQKKPTMLNLFIKVFMIMLTVLFFLSGLLIYPLFLLAGLLMIFADMWVIPRQNIEYEYSYVNGDLDIDKIFSKKSRKHVTSFHINDAEVIAPATSGSLDGYKTLPIVDFTAGTEEDRKNAWVMVIASQNARKRVYFSPNENMLKDIRMRTASKFHAN